MLFDIHASKIRAKMALPGPRSVLQEPSNTTACCTRSGGLVAHGGGTGHRRRPAKYLGRFATAHQASVAQAHQGSGREESRDRNWRADPDGDIPRGAGPTMDFLSSVYCLQCIEDHMYSIADPRCSLCSRRRMQNYCRLFPLDKALRPF